MKAKSLFLTACLPQLIIFAVPVHADSILTGATVVVDQIQQYQNFDSHGTYLGDTVNVWSNSFIESDPSLEIEESIWNEFTGNWEVWRVIQAFPNEPDLRIHPPYFEDSITLNNNYLSIEWGDCCYRGNGTVTDSDGSQSIMLFEGFEFTFKHPDSSLQYLFSNIANHSEWLPNNRVSVAGNKIRIDLKDNISYGSAYGPLYLTFDAQVAPVPLPAAFWLFGGGLFSLLGLKRQGKD